MYLLRRDVTAKITLLVLLGMCLSLPCFSVSAAQVIQEAVIKSREADVDITQLLDDVEKKAESAALSDKRALYAFLASLAEQLGMYDKATGWYVEAAGIAANPAPNTTPYTTEQLVLSAVRCSLNSGNWQQAENYLGYIRNSANAETVSYVKLYSVWSMLCKANTKEDLLEPVKLLEAYAELDSMKNVRPEVLLTLWYVTEDTTWKNKLIKDHKASPEAALVSGIAQMMPSPFWYFLPKDPLVLGADSSSQDDGGDEAVVSQQVGFFQSKTNAENLVQRLKDAGFTPKIKEEVRASGTTYYMVVVPENAEGSMGLKLKSAGFECYPVFEN